MNDETGVSDLMNLLKKILAESSHHVKEINHHHLQFILRQRFGVRYSSKAIQKALQGRGWTLTSGWGRGKDYLRRIPEDIQLIENIS
jgi:transposase